MKNLSAPLIRSWIPKRDKSAHKGSAGRVLIIAGSRGMSGSAILSAMGAVQAGSGLVRAAVVKSIQPIFSRRAPLEVTSAGLKENASGHISGAALSDLKQTLKNFKPDIVAVGPGLGSSTSTRSLMLFLVHKTSIPLVADADALNVLRLSDFKKKRNAPWVITPHVGELGRLLKSEASEINQARERFVKLGAQKTGAICLLKGNGTLIAHQSAVWKNPTGNPGMASAGMGDILTGIIAGLWGQYPEQDWRTGLQAACVGAFLHGKAGDLAQREAQGLSLRATTLAEFIPAAIKSTR